ncbi:hypothetical protein LTR95_007940 [Oleoguttula sp. CCFEE 5521]
MTDHTLEAGKEVAENSSNDGGSESLPPTGASDRAAFLATFSRAEDKAIMKKVDRRFLLLIGMLYMTKNIDNQNAANVKVLQVGQQSNILRSLSMSADQYNWVQSVYFTAYIIFEVPSNLLLKKFTPRLRQSRICLSWGIVLTCHAAVQNKESLYTVRFLLGMMEASVFPGLAAQLTSWYRSDEMGKPIMCMFGWQNLSGVVGSLLAYGISYMNGLCGLEAWRWVYLLEGIYTILLAGVIYLVLPDYPKSPRSSKWLTEREQDYLEARLSENAPRTDEAAFSKHEVYTSLKDPRTYSFMINQILVNLAGYGLQWYFPTITTNLGFAGLPRNQLLDIGPAGWLLKQAFLTRPAFTRPINVTMVISFILFFTAWRSSTLAWATGTAFTLAFQSSIGQIGGVIGPQLFQSKFAHNGYKTPFAICAAATIVGWAASLVTWWLTRNVEWDVRRIRRLRIKAEKEGKVCGEDDVRFYQERDFYHGLRKDEAKA